MKVPGNSWHVHHRVVMLTITVTVLLGVLALWAAVASGSASPATSGTPSPSASPVTLRLGWDEGPLNLNPVVGYSNSYEIWMLNYDTLVAFGADGKPSTETGLADKWETSPDYKVWTFHIRHGVTWQDFEVANLRSGKPTLLLHGVAAKFAESLGVRNISLSITHTAELGMAHVILED